MLSMEDRVGIGHPLSDIRVHILRVVAIIHIPTTDRHSITAGSMGSTPCNIPSKSVIMRSVSRDPNTSGKEQT